MQYSALACRSGDLLVMRNDLSHLWVARDPVDETARHLGGRWAPSMTLKMRLRTSLGAVGAEQREVYRMADSKGMSSPRVRRISIIARKEEPLGRRTNAAFPVGSSNSPSHRGVGCTFWASRPPPACSIRERLFDAAMVHARVVPYRSEFLRIQAFGLLYEPGSQQERDCAAS